MCRENYAMLALIAGRASYLCPGKLFHKGHCNEGLGELEKKMQKEPNA